MQTRAEQHRQVAKTTDLAQTNLREHEGGEIYELQPDHKPGKIIIGPWLVV